MNKEVFILKKVNLRKLCFAAIMAALFVVIELLSHDIGSQIKITFDGLPILISSFVLGPVWGGIVGFTGSFISQLINYGLSFSTFLWVLPAVIRGILAGIIFNAFKKNINFLSVGTTVISTSLIVTVLNTLIMIFESIVLGYYSYTFLSAATAFRFVSSVITAVAYMLVITPLLKITAKQIKHYF